MNILDAVISKVPSVQGPKSYLNFRKRLVWTAIILVTFLILGQITVYGVSEVSRERFQFLDIILGSSFGSLMTLGIGPIVTASIILQLLVGSKILGWNLRTEEGKRRFQGTQKLLTVLFCFIEAIAFSSFGAIQPLSPAPELYALIIIQLALGGIIVLFMDEVISKWGIGSGVSLFIAAGVTRGIFIQALNPFPLPNDITPAGRIPQFVLFMQDGLVSSAILSLLPLLATALVFLIVIYVQAMKVEIPLSFGTIRGFSRRWPLQLIYTNTIPIILIGALIANVQLAGSIAAVPQPDGTRCGLLGCFDQNSRAISGLSYFMTVPNSVSVQVFFITLLAVIFLVNFVAYYTNMKYGNRVLIASIIGGFVLAALATSSFVTLPTMIDSVRVLTYLLVITAGATVFSIFWIQTSGMDSRSVAEQIEGMGMQIPGFRRDPRIVEQVLDRYIPALAVISGVFIGTLASVADFTSALGTGTGILLTVMIIYNLYEQISQKYMEDMHPALRKFFQ